MHILMKLAVGVAALAGASALSACGNDRYGYGRGYGGVAVGYGAAVGNPYWGWNDNFYYPGTGRYVYDNQRRRHRWNNVQRGYWESRRSNWRGDRRMRSNWRDFRAPRGRR